MITDETKEKLKKQPKWVQDLVNNLDGATETYKKQLAAVQGVPKADAHKKVSYLEDMQSDMVVPFDQYTTVHFQVGPERYQIIRIKFHEAEFGNPPSLVVYAEDRISVKPNSSNSVELVPED